MDAKIVKDSLQKYRDEARKNAIERRIIRREGTTRMWFKGTTLVDMDIEVRRNGHG